MTRPRAPERPVEDDAEFPTGHADDLPDYGTLIGGAHAGITGRLDALETELVEQAKAGV